MPLGCRGRDDLLAGTGDCAAAGSSDCAATSSASDAEGAGFALLLLLVRLLGEFAGEEATSSEAE